MPVARHLGAAWASVHAPHDPRSLLVWLLERDFRGLGAAPAARTMDWAALREMASDLPVAFPVVRAGSALAEIDATAGAGSSSDGEQQVAFAAVAEAVRVARVLGTPHVVLAPGLVPLMGEIEHQDLGDPSSGWTLERAQALVARRSTGLGPALDRVCRFLHAVVRRYPDFRFSLTTSRNLRTVADRNGLEAVFEDLSSLGLGYWHDAAVVARREQLLGESQGEWLETFARRLRGGSMADASAEGLGLLPGTGVVDWSALAAAVPRTGQPMPWVLELDPSVDPREMQGVRSFLDRHGL